MGVNAFVPLGNTTTFTAAISPPTPVQVVGLAPGGGQFRLLNAGSSTVFLGVGATAALATANAAVVTTTGAAIPLLAGTDEILTFPIGSYFTGGTISGTSVVYITPGDGV
jgi:hypothetical protein